jgi:catechol 2,3-dioxygenase-like lactoylglutathione lyase family enzyme
MARWYTRPVVFTDDLARSLAFYLQTLGFAKDWHEGDGAGTVCQVSRDGCEVILCEDAVRRDRSRLFVSLDDDGIAKLRADLEARSIVHNLSWWGSDVIEIADPDGNQLMFSFP